MQYNQKIPRISGTFLFVTVFLLIFISSISIAAVFSAPQVNSPRTDAEKTSQATAVQDNILIDRPEDVYIGSGPQSKSHSLEKRWDDYSRETPHIPSSQLLHMGGRDLEAHFVNTPNGPILQLDGHQQPVRYDDAELDAQLALWGLPSLRLSGVQILNGPQTIIGELRDGVNISLVDSPGSTIRHNIIANVTGNSTHPAFGIALDNCSNSVIINNTVQHIFTNASTAAITGAAYGIFVNNSENVIISENRIKNVTAQGFDASSGAADSFGIYVENCTGAAITLNNITDILGNSSGTGASPFAIFMQASNHSLIQDNRIGNLTSLGPNNYIHVILIEESSHAATLANLTIRGNLFTESFIPTTENVDTINRINIETVTASGNVINVTIENNKFTGTTSSAFGANKSYGIRVYGEENVSNLFIANNWFENTSTTGKSSDVYSYGIAVEAMAAINNGTVYNNTFIDNSATSTAISGNAASYGIYLDSAGQKISDILAQENTFTDNSANGEDSGGLFKSYGIYLNANEQLTNATAIENIFTDNSATVSTGNAYSYGVFFISWKANKLVVANNTFMDNSATSSGATESNGIRLSTGSGGGITNSLVNGNNITDNSASGGGPTTSYGIYFLGSSAGVINATVTANNVTNNAATSTSDAATSYGICVDSSGPSRNIWIQANSFTEAATTAPGAVAAGSTTYGIRISQIEELFNATVTENTFTNTSATVTNLQSAYSYGTFLSSSKNINTVLISKNVFENNSATNSASGTSRSAVVRGIYIRSSSSNISNVQIQENRFAVTSSYGTAGGSVVSAGIYFETAADKDLTNISVTENVFANNSATSPDGRAYTNGIRFWTRNANQLIVADNTFTDNSATSNGETITRGIRLYTQSGGGINNSWIQGNTFGDNSAIGVSGSTEEIGAFGIYLIGNSAGVINTTIIANIFANNSATATSDSASSDGIYVTSAGKIDIVNISRNAITNNSVTGASGGTSHGIYIVSSLDLTNAIVSENTFTNNSALAVTSGNAISGGIWVSSGSGATSSSKIALSWNVFGMINATASAGTGTAYGVYLSHVNETKVDFNTISTIAATTTIHALYFDRCYNMSLAFEPEVAHNFSWTDSVASFSAYTLYRNDTGIDSGSWPSDVLLETDGLAYGVYNFTIDLADSGSNVTASFFVTITDATAPKLSNFPSDLTYEAGTAPPTTVLIWTLTDLHPDRYIIYQSGSHVANGTWASGTPIGLTVAGLMGGIYKYTFVANDTFGNVRTHEVFVTVTDTTAPTVTSPAPVTYEAGTTGHNLTWVPTDIHTGTYEVYRNGTQIGLVDDTWAPGTAIVLSIDNLAVGVYNYTLVLTDAFGNSRKDEVFVTVIDTTAPTVTSPAPVTYEAGTTGHNLTWVPADIHTGTYEVYRNGTSITLVDNTWAPGTPIVLPIDNLAVGVYNYTLVLTDAFGNSRKDEVFVTVIDTTAPTVTSPTPVTYEAGTTGHNLTWVPADANAGIYEVYRNGTEVVNGTWTPGSPIVVVIDNLAVGIYNYTIVLTDVFGHSTADTVLVTVADTTAPVLAGPADITYGEDPTEPVLLLSWTATDLYPGTYTILQNGMQIASGAWTASIPIALELEVLTAGVYNFTIVITDASGNSVSDTVIITIAEEEPVSEAGDEGLDPIFLIGGITVVGVAAVGASGGVAYWFIRIRKKP